MADATRTPQMRPLSPHLQIYRWPLSMALSILHRATGCGLVMGLMVLSAWVVAAATSPGAFGCVQALLGTWIGRLCLLGWTWAVFFHLCSGLRHLAWDAGFGFDLSTSFRSSVAVLVVSGGLTIVAFAIGMGF